MTLRGSMYPLRGHIAPHVWRGLQEYCHERDIGNRRYIYIWISY